VRKSKAMRRAIREVAEAHKWTVYLAQDFHSPDLMTVERGKGKSRQVHRLTLDVRVPFIEIANIATLLGCTVSEIGARYDENVNIVEVN